MSDADALNLVLFIFRVAIGVTFVMHGYNKVKNGLAGTAGWFGSMGMRPPLVQAWMAALTEIGSGVLLVLGLLTPLAGAGIVGTMLVAWVIAHRKNGFFIFLPGGGWEFVMVLLVVGITIGTIGAGEWSLDHALGIDDDLWGATGLYLSAGLGLIGGAALLATCWRPPAASDQTA